MADQALSLDQQIKAAVAAMQAGNPLVHCITNYVAMSIAANTLLAAGASPAMVHTPEESGDFAAIASALTVNIGTLSPHWVEGMKKAIDAANSAQKSWVLDPVAHFATPYRAATTQELLAMGPTIIRGNASEIMALAGEASAGQGVDSGDAVSAAEGAARALAKKHSCVVAITGEIDFVCDANHELRVTGGSPLMSQITAMGCSLTALMGAFAAVEEDKLIAAAAALAMFGEVGEQTAKAAKGPGSFAWQFLDGLASLKAEDIAADRVS